MAAVTGIRGFREALQIRGRGEVQAGGRGIPEWRSSSGILVGGRTELALFTAINSLPLTAYCFLLPGFLLVPTPSSDPLLHRAFSSVVRIPGCRAHFEAISVFFFFSSLRTLPQCCPRLAEASESGEDRCASLSRLSAYSRCSLYTHARAFASNLTGRFARGNLKCKTEMRADRVPRGIFCGRECPRALRCRR